MDTDSDSDPQHPDRVGDGTSTANGPCGPVEGGDQSVTGRVDLPSAEARELAPHDRVIAIQKVTPLSVTQSRRLVRGPHDIHKHDGRQHALRLARLARS